VDGAWRDWLFTIAANVKMPVHAQGPTGVWQDPIRPIWPTGWPPLITVLSEDLTARPCGGISPRARDCVVDGPLTLGVNMAGSSIFDKSSRRGRHTVIIIP